MRGATAVRFAIEAAFLVGVAVVLGSLNQRWPVILPAMAAALAVTYASEWTASRIRRGGKPSARDEPAAGALEGGQSVVPEPSAPLGAVMPERPLEPSPGHVSEAVAEAAAEHASEPEPQETVAEPAPVPEPVAEVGPAALEPATPMPIESTDGERRRLFRPRPRPLPPEPEPAAELVARESEPSVRAGPAPQPPPVPAAAAEEAGVPPEQPPEIAPEPPAAESEPAAEPEVAPESEPEPVQPAPDVESPRLAPVLVAVPALPPEPEPAEPAAAQAAGSEVVTLRSRGPREWNLWELERLTREHSGADAFRDEERAYLLVYLREFANPDGILPIDFDGLVRESFGDLVGAG